MELVLGVVTGEMPTITADAAKQTQFVTNVTNYMVQKGFDGLDVDWEYPDTATEWSNFTKLIFIRVDYRRLW